MRFKCGQTQKEKRAAYIQAVTTWHLWFAWHPVRLQNHQCAWLEWIWRIGTFEERFEYDSDGGSYSTVVWEYQGHREHIQSYEPRKNGKSYLQDPPGPE